MLRVHPTSVEGFVDSEKNCLSVLLIFPGSIPMPIPLIETPDALDTAIAASVQIRRDKMLRRVRNQKIRMGIALGLSGCIALFALTAYLISDYAAARFCALSACVVVAFTCITGAAARKNVVDALREMDRTA